MKRSGCHLKERCSALSESAATARSMKFMCASRGRCFTIQKPGNYLTDTAFPHRGKAFAGVPTQLFVTEMSIFSMLVLTKVQLPSPLHSCGIAAAGHMALYRFLLNPYIILCPSLMSYFGSPVKVCCQSPTAVNPDVSMILSFCGQLYRHVACRLPYPKHAEMHVCSSNIS